MEKWLAICIFLDLRSAFDSVNRRLLIESLLEIGLLSCFVAIIAAMYRRVKFVVKVMGKFSRLVMSHLGVKEGCTLSPKLFSLFVNDLDSFMKKSLSLIGSGYHVYYL